MNHAIQIDEHGGTDVMQWREIPLADPAPGEVRIRHHALVSTTSMSTTEADSTRWSRFPSYREQRPPAS